MQDKSADSGSTAGLGEEMLKIWARQGRRVWFPVAFCALVMALMAAPRAPLWLWSMWLVLTLGVLALRYHLLGRLPHLHTVSLHRRLNGAVALAALNGLLFGASIAFAPYLSDYQRMVQTILLLGLCAGAVAVTAGYQPVLLAFVLPVTLANSLAWFTGSGGVHGVGWIEGVVGGLILGFAWVLAGLARDVSRVFSDSVAIRQQQVATNQHLRLALQQAESAMQAKTRFLASASHDLRQPMHTLSLFSAALMKRHLDPASADIVRHMNLAVHSLAEQMDAALDIYKLDAQGLPVRAEVFALWPWLTRLCQELQPAAQRKGLLLHLETPAPDVVDEALVDTDPYLLGRVLRNLIDNAIKYTEQGEVSLRIERHAAGGDIWRLVVRDTGCGIAQAEQSRVFEEFYQIGNPERDRAKGLGLGLSIVSRLVDLLDLHLDLQSAPGEGSTFSISIAAVDGLPAPKATDGPPLSTQLPAALRVLVLDDEEPVRLALSAVLSGLGCEVMVAPTMREALVKGLLCHPDILLADLRLRGVDDGIAAVRSLRGALPGLPALLISGDMTPERLAEAQEAGLTLLQKPVREDQLLRAMQAALAERSSLSLGVAPTSTAPLPGADRRVVLPFGHSAISMLTTCGLRQACGCEIGSRAVGWPGLHRRRSAPAPGHPSA